MHPYKTKNRRYCKLCAKFLILDPSVLVCPNCDHRIRLRAREPSSRILANRIYKVGEPLPQIVKDKMAKSRIEIYNWKKQYSKQK